MAILKAPLMSMGAAQALGRTLVFFTWKGLDVVREYIVPANPRTAGQVTQRGILTDAVATIHTAQAAAANALAALDVTAYALWASTFAAPRTWFNQAAKNFIETVVFGSTGVIFGGGAGPGAIPTEITLHTYSYGSNPVAGKYFYGTSKTALINSIAATIAGNHQSKTIAGLTTGVKYYVQFRSNAADPTETARSGIYAYTCP